MPHVAVITDVLEAMDEKHGALSEHEIILLIGGTLFFFFFEVNEGKIEDHVVAYVYDWGILKDHVLMSDDTEIY